MIKCYKMWHIMKKDYISKWKIVLHDKKFKCQPIEQHNRRYSNLMLPALNYFSNTYQTFYIQWYCEIQFGDNSFDISIYPFRKLIWDKTRTRYLIEVLKMYKHSFHCSLYGKSIIIKLDTKYFENSMVLNI